jgi:hypothetical protein
VNVQAAFLFASIVPNKVQAAFSSNKKLNINEIFFIVFVVQHLLYNEFYS